MYITWIYWDDRFHPGKMDPLIPGLGMYMHMYMYIYRYIYIYIHMYIAYT